jgi:3,4-dihydroxy 2-butanone 4-phosphate synthase / GTP cyclohydrolase II
MPSNTRSTSAKKSKSNPALVGIQPGLDDHSTPPFHSIDEILEDIRAGKMVIITDDEDRENEGDLICAAEKITPEMVNFMVREGGGMLCVPIEPADAQRMGLESMVAKNEELFKTHFTVTVDAKQGLTTGISTVERATTIRTLAAAGSGAGDFIRPGHVNPLIAKTGGVLRRAGHTEAAVDLAKLAGLRPAGVLIEILDSTGIPARLPGLHDFAKKHGLKISSIAKLIDHRRQREKLVAREQVIHMPTDYGDFQLYLYRSLIDDQHHLALVKGNIDSAQPVLVRVHSECLTGDVFGSRRCDCGPQLQTAMQQVEAAGSGVILYMRQEGRGIGLPAKIHAYKLQEQGYDTVEANIKLGFPMDLRDYGVGAQILHDLGVRKIRLMTNNPKKIVGLSGHSLEVVAQVPIELPANEHNQHYLKTKKDKMGHLLK